MAKYSGKKGTVYISTSGTGAATAIVGLNEWSLDMKTERLDTTEFGAANKTTVQGFPDVTGRLSGFWDDTSDTLYDASKSADGCRLYLYPASTAASKFFAGPAWVDFSITTAANDAVKVTATFSANGDWTQA